MLIRNDKMESHASQGPADTGYVLSRRRFLRHTILSSGVASLPLTLLPEGWSWGMKPMRKCRIHGGLWWVHADMRTANETFWREQVRYQKSAGFDYLWLCSTTQVIQALNQGAPLDPYPILLDEAEKNGMEVFLETYITPSWWVNVDWEKEKKSNTALIPELAARYASHPAFKGWYLGYETHHAEGEYGIAYKDLLVHVRKQCRLAAPDKPVLISPFFLLDREGLLGFRWIPPDEFSQFWADMLSSSGIDILALQDSGEHLACYSIEERRPFLQAGLEACQQGGKSFWVNVETGELDLESVAEYKEHRAEIDLGGVGKYWQRVPLEKLAEKIGLACQFSDRLLTWGYAEYWRPHLGAAAKDYYDRYLAWVKQ